jgi:hypothetical protein
VRSEDTIYLGGTLYNTRDNPLFIFTTLSYILLSVKSKIHLNIFIPNTMAIDKQEIEKLKASLSPSSEVLTPDSEGYAESLKRWSSAAEKPAVGISSILN